MCLTVYIYIYIYIYYIYNKHITHKAIDSHDRCGQFGSNTLAYTYKTLFLPEIKQLYNTLQRVHVFEISKQCRQSVPTPRGTILQPPTASQSAI